MSASTILLVLPRSSYITVYSVANAVVPLCGRVSLCCARRRNYILNKGSTATARGLPEQRPCTAYRASPSGDVRAVCYDVRAKMVHYQSTDDILRSKLQTKANLVNSPPLPPSLRLPVCLSVKQLLQRPVYIHCMYNTRVCHGW